MTIKYIRSSWIWYKLEKVIQSYRKTCGALYYIPSPMFFQNIFIIHFISRDNKIDEKSVYHSLILSFIMLIHC